MQKAYPHLKETKGSVVNFASAPASSATTASASDAAAKEGIRGLTRVAANEWGKDGVNVNIVCPLAWTAQLENFEVAYPEAFKANVHMPPAGHYGDVEKEIGRVVVRALRPRLQVHERRDGYPRRRHGPAPRRARHSILRHDSGAGMTFRSMPAPLHVNLQTSSPWPT